MRRSIAVAVLVASLFTVTSCAGQASAPSPTATAEPPDVDIDDLGAESITVQPFGDFVMSSGDLVWVSGVAPGIVAYDHAMQAVFEVAAGTVWAALEFGHGYIWPARHQTTPMPPRCSGSIRPPALQPDSRCHHLASPRNRRSPSPRMRSGESSLHRAPAGPGRWSASIHCLAKCFAPSTSVLTLSQPYAAGSDRCG